MPSRSSFLFIAIALLSAVGEVFAADEAQIVPLAITPATEPVPSLQYQLLPKHLDRRPGNAAVRYERAALQYRPEAKVDTDVAEWLDLPFAEFAQPAQLKKMSTESEKVFAELRRASQLESCHWELPLREQMSRGTSRSKPVARSRRSDSTRPLRRCKSATDWLATRPRVRR